MESTRSSGLSTAQANDLLGLIQQTQVTSHSGHVMSSLGAARNHFLTQPPASTPRVRKDQELRNLIHSLKGIVVGQSSTAPVPVSMTTNHHHQLLGNNTFWQRQLSCLDELLALQTMTYKNSVSIEQQTINVDTYTPKSNVKASVITGYPVQLHHHHRSHGAMTPLHGSRLAGLNINALGLAPRAQQECHANQAISAVQQQGQGQAISETSAIIPGNQEEEDGSTDSFPFKVYRLLACAEKAGKTHIISFCPDGMAFKIHDPCGFEREIMPLFFNTNRVASFQRQLNQYGFKRVTEGHARGGFRHKHFMNGNPLSCKKIIRKKRAPSKMKASSPPKSDLPNSASEKVSPAREAGQDKKI